jgi:cell division protease FtsH
MKNDNHSKSQWFSQRKSMLIAGSMLGLLLFLMAVVQWTQAKSAEPELVSISEVAASIMAGEITRIETNASGSGFRVYYRSGAEKLAMRELNASLLEQLNLLGVTRTALMRVQFEMAAGQAAGANNSQGLIFIAMLVGLPLTAMLYLQRRDRTGKKNYRETEIPGMRFKDVAGLDENLQELEDIVNFLKQGNQYSDLGAQMPRGVLMVGDPGTGKTLVAKAIAGEAGVPFFATSGSEFVEMYVGVGASRVRKLFQNARKKAPCIIFIDEIDAVGRARRRSDSGAEMEQDQTLNQLLVEMDGFDRSEGIIVLAATNRLDVLDAALTRPGRFDRRVYIHRPDVRGREAILSIHIQGKKLAQDVVLQNVAKATPGLVGADLANIVNEAAISAVRSGRHEIEMQDFDEAIEKILAGGVQRKSYVMREEERRIVAFHEAGHAVVMQANQLCDPVHKITIIPRGQAGGYTMALPENDQMLISRCKMLARITGLLGGRAAEEIFFQDITNGASNDLKVSTQLAEEMVMRLGMDPRAGLRVVSQERIHFSGAAGSQKMQEAIDGAVHDILESCYHDALRILTEQRAQIERVADALLEEETLNREQFLALMSE